VVDCGPDVTALKCRINVNDELERTCKEMVVTYSKILHPKVPDKAEGNNEIPKSRQSAFEHRRC